VYEGVLELLDDLQRSGTRIALMTNTADTARQVELIRKLGLSVYFNANNTIISSEIGWRKPNPDLFKMVCLDVILGIFLRFV
jgi:FMN phosphatase YigB (HAD superfamily)